MFRELIAYEIDPAAAPALQARARRQANVSVVIGDFLAARPPREPFHVAGNAPFSLTSPIVDWCLHARSMTSATLITQLEYARKRTGAYGRWSLLTVSTWPQVQWDLRGTIGRDQFRPVPRVDAGILRLTAARAARRRPAAGYLPAAGADGIQRRGRVAAGVAAP